MSKKKEESDNDMAIIIERIITIQKAESDEFIKIQRRRIEQLHQIEIRREQGKKIKKKMILDKLHKAGILDDSGNLASYYYEED